MVKDTQCQWKVENSPDLQAHRKWYNPSAFFLSKSKCVYRQVIVTFFDSVEDELAFQQQFRKGCGSCALNLDSLQVETRLILTFLGIGEVGLVGWLGGWVQNDETRAEWIEWLEKIRAWNCQEEMKSLRFWEFWKCSMASSKKLRFQGLFANLSNGNGSKAGTLSNYFCWGRFGFRIFETSPSREHFGSTHQ